MNLDEIMLNLRIVTGAERPPESSRMHDVLMRLDAIAKDESLPGDLAHYLSRRSYVKALEYLDNPDMPHKA